MTSDLFTAFSAVFCTRPRFLDEKLPVKTVTYGFSAGDG